MDVVTVRRDFGAQEIKICRCFHFFTFCLPWSDGTGFHNLSLWFCNPTPSVYPREFIIHVHAHKQTCMGRSIVAVIIIVKYQKVDKVFCWQGCGENNKTYISSSVQFSHSFVSDSLRPHGLQHARLPCPSPTPEVCSNSCPLSQWCHPTVSSSVVIFSSCLQSSPASGSF